MWLLLLLLLLERLMVLLDDDDGDDGGDVGGGEKGCIKMFWSIGIVVVIVIFRSCCFWLWLFNDVPYAIYLFTHIYGLTWTYSILSAYVFPFIYGIMKATHLHIFGNLQNLNIYIYTIHRLIHIHIRGYQFSSGLRTFEVQ